MGLERMASRPAGVESNYDTDLFAPIIDRLREVLGHDPEDVRGRAVQLPGHRRPLAGGDVPVGDGVLPSNEGRGYVLRRILRRAVRHGRLLGRREPFLHETAEVVIDLMGDVYPNLLERRDAILGTILREEQQFARTLDAGTDQLEEALIPLTSAERVVGRREETLPADAPVLPGDIAFRLHDTFGFPIDLTIEGGRRVRRPRRPGGLRGGARRAARAAAARPQGRAGAPRRDGPALPGHPRPHGAHGVRGIRDDPRRRGLRSSLSCATASSTPS